MLFSGVIFWKREKISQEREETPKKCPSSGCKIDFSAREEGGGRIIWFTCIMYSIYSIHLVVFVFFLKFVRSSSKIENYPARYPEIMNVSAGEPEKRRRPPARLADYTNDELIRLEDYLCFTVILSMQNKKRDTYSSFTCFPHSSLVFFSSIWS